MKDVFKNKKFIYAIIILIIILILGFGLSVFYTNKISIRKVLNTKYDDVRCIDNACNGILTSEKDSKITNYKVLNSKGVVVGNYSYKNNIKNVKQPYKLTDNYMLMKKVVSKTVNEYSINSKNAKEYYKTKNDLTSINEYSIIESIKTDNDYVYNILNKNGKTIVNNFTDYESYSDGVIISGKKGGHSYIFNKKGKELLENYLVEGEYDKYLIIKSSSNDLYYYFNIDEEKIVNEGFSSFIVKNDNSLEVTRKENNKKVVYYINEDGKEEDKKDGVFLFDLISKYEKKIGTNYKIYTNSVIDENTTKIFVDNYKDNSFGVYDINEDSYDKMYDYTTSASYTEINTLKSNNDDIYFQISCSKPMCYENILYVYNYTNSKIEFNLVGSDKLATEYNQYKNGYKVVKFSKNSENENYKNKYVLYNKNDKKIEKKSNPITVLGSELLIGQNYDKSLLYSKKDKKIINDDDTLASLVDEKYYNYGSIYVDLKGNLIYNVPSGSSYLYNNGYITSTKNESVKVFDIKESKIYQYKLNDNESLLTTSNEKMNPYKSLVIINNSKNNTIKIINVKTNKAKKIKNANVFDIKYGNDNKKAYIFTTTKIDKKIKYGLYVLD